MLLVAGTESLQKGFLLKMLCKNQYITLKTITKNMTNDKNSSLFISRPGGRNGMSFGILRDGQDRRLGAMQYRVTEVPIVDL